MLNLHLPDMSCGHCKKAVETAVRAVDQSATLDFDMEKRTVKIATQSPSTDVLSALADAGYPAGRD